MTSNQCYFNIDINTVYIFIYIFEKKIVLVLVIYVHLSVFFNFYISNNLFLFRFYSNIST